MLVEPVIDTHVSFEEIQVSAIFTYGNQYYIKIEKIADTQLDYETEYNAVHLQSGRVASFKSYDPVIQRDMKLVPA